jgi:hypothetical protein
MILKTRLLLLVAAAVVACSLVGGAAAATGKAPVLDREQVGPWYSTPSTTCTPLGGGASVAVGYSLRGFATLPYSSANFTSNGTARLAVAGGYGYLAALDATFSLPSGIGTVTGTITAGPATKGQGTCYPDTGAAELEIRGALYTAQLPDGTTDTGIADVLVSSMPGAAPFSIAFDSTRSPTVDADRDAVWDGDDNCATTPNADQRDVDGDFVGDVCDTYDNRPPLTLLGELWGETKSTSNGNKLAGKLDHAINALQAGQVSVACTDVAGYISQVQSARGKTIPAAMADTWIAKARHIRLVLGC